MAEARTVREIIIANGRYFVNPARMMRCFNNLSLAQVRSKSLSAQATGLKKLGGRHISLTETFGLMVQQEDIGPANRARLSFLNTGRVRFPMSPLFI